MKNIVLTGFMGCGKSTIGRKLSKILKLNFLDSDSFIAQKYSMSIDEIFSTHGEASFREMERDFVKEFSGKENLVIATGGGMPIYCDTRPLGVRFFLDMRFALLYERISKKSHRPLAKDREQILKIYQSRKRKYISRCEHKINANTSMAKTIDLILKALQNRQN